MRFGRHLLAATVAALALTGGYPTQAIAQGVVVEQVIIPRPPERRVEVQYAAPGAEYVWHRGDWVYSPELRNFVWHPGHWVMRPDAQHVYWFPGEWVEFAGSWRFVPGHWRTVVEGPAPRYSYAQMAEVVKEPPPPAMEPRPALQPGYEWDPGHWAWDGEAYRWVRGHWLFVPREYHRWVPGHWYHHDRYFSFKEGYWAA
jgi:hypothetical protein